MNRQTKQILDDYEQSIEGIDFDMRMDLAEIITSSLADNRWSQVDLGSRSGIDPSVLSRLIHARENFTVRTVARIVHALGLRGKIQAVLPEATTNLRLSYGHTGVGDIDGTNIKAENPKRSWIVAGPSHADAA